MLVVNVKFLLAHCTLKGYREQLLRLDGKFHGQFVEHLLGVAVDDETHGLLGGDAALVAVEELVFADLPRSSESQLL